MRIGEGGLAEHSSACPLDCLVLCFSNLSSSSLPGLVGELVTLQGCKRGNVTDSPANHLEEILRKHVWDFTQPFVGLMEVSIECKLDFTGSFSRIGQHQPFQASISVTSVRCF